MDLDIPHLAPNRRDEPRVGDDERIRPRPKNAAGERRGRTQLAIVHEDVQRHVQARPVRAAERGGAPQLVEGKIGRRRPGVEGAGAGVDGIRAGGERRREGLEGARWRKQFR